MTNKIFVLLFEPLYHFSRLVFPWDPSFLTHISLKRSTKLAKRKLLKNLIGLQFCMWREEKQRHPLTGNCVLLEILPVLVPFLKLFFVLLQYFLVGKLFFISSMTLFACCFLLPRVFEATFLAYRLFLVSFHNEWKRTRKGCSICDGHFEYFSLFVQAWKNSKILSSK